MNNNAGNRSRVQYPPRSRFKATLLGLMLMLAGCTNSEPSPLRVGLLVWPPYEMGFLARELGHFDGQPIELVEFHSPGITLRAYNSGAIDVVALTTHYVHQLAAQDPEQRIILMTNVSNGADTVLSRPEIDSLPELAGRRIGVERSALGAYMLQRVLDKAGLTASDVQIVSEDVSDGPEVYERGLVDAVITYEPYRTRIMALGAHELLTSRELPNEIIDVLITRESIIEERGPAVNALVNGWLHAVEAFKRNPLEHGPAMAAREGLDTDAFIDALDGVTLADRALNQAWLGEHGIRLVEKLSDEARVLRRAGFLNLDLEYAPLVHGDFIDAEAAE